MMENRTSNFIKGKAKMKGKGTHKTNTKQKKVPLKIPSVSSISKRVVVRKTARSIRQKRRLESPCMNVIHVIDVFLAGLLGY